MEITDISGSNVYFPSDFQLFVDHTFMELFEVEFRVGMRLVLVKRQKTRDENAMLPS
jgi:hypothetical protein